MASALPPEAHLRPPSLSPSSTKSSASSIASNSSNATLPSSTSTSSAHLSAMKYAHQAAKLSHLPPDPNGSDEHSAAVKAEFITAQDAVIVTADGSRLPAVPPQEAHKLNSLKAELEGDFEDLHTVDGNRISRSASRSPLHRNEASQGSLRKNMPPFRTNPLFPPLPLYGPPSLMRDAQCMVFRCTSAVLSLCFLLVIVLGALFTSIPTVLKRLWARLNLRDFDEGRPFYEQEKRNAQIRKQKEEKWLRQHPKDSTGKFDWEKEPLLDEQESDDPFPPTEGGPDPLICDIPYYARRVGLDAEKFLVQTEDGFLIDLYHIYDPKTHTPRPREARAPRSPDLFTHPPSPPKPAEKRKYPVLLMHGLLQSAGAYTVNDDSSLAFYLAKSGFDVWLGSNRCGFTPQHTLLSPSDPRMWAWNIRAMGVLDLPALISRVLAETGFSKLGLVAHSQGTTQTLVALAKEQRPDLGEKISVFCALAPAAYAGPLIGKMYFKFMRIISPSMFRIWFGIHSFIPVMLTMHRWLPGGVYGKMGYQVFSFLFNWSDERWDRGLRDRLFQFSPVYVSAESMRWWLGRECFARQKCILQTREEWKSEEQEDAAMQSSDKSGEENRQPPAAKPNTEEANSEMHEYFDKVASDDRRNRSPSDITMEVTSEATAKKRRPKGSTAWYDARAPPMAFWVAGSDELVDGRRLLRRFRNGREPHVRVVHEKIIEEYEHLDVIWAMDSIEKVGREVKEVLWKTVREDVRQGCVVPGGCVDIPVWEEIKKEEEEEDGSQSDSSDEDEEEKRREEKKKKHRRGWRRLFHR